MPIPEQKNQNGHINPDGFNLNAKVSYNGKQAANFFIKAGFPFMFILRVINAVNKCFSPDRNFNQVSASEVMRISAAFVWLKSTCKRPCLI